MRTLNLALLALAVSLPLGAEAAFWDRATSLIAQGKVEEAGKLAQGILETNPDDVDALVVVGTTTLYQKMTLQRPDSIYRPDVEPLSDRQPHFSAQAVDAAASYWKRVPPLDPSRSYLWGDLAQLAFRAGDTVRAVDFALEALKSTTADPDSLKNAASVLALNLEWSKAALALARIPGNKTALLYQGLDAWRLGKDGWRGPLKAFVDNPGADPAGKPVAEYLISSAMRDGEAGYAEAARTEVGIAALAVRQKTVERYPNKFLARLELGRGLAQLGSYAKALAQFNEIDRRGLASTPDERQSVLFQQAWANQAAGRHLEAARLWEMVATSRDFYLRSAASWFLGEYNLAQGKIEEAKDWWSKVATEPARSKYAYWAAEELKKLE